MEPGRVDAFFYGLFMDARVLREAGTTPSNFRRACVADFALRIGQRATLVPSPGDHAYGMLVSLTRADLDRLYGGPCLEAYRPQTVLARPDEGEPVPALCYNLVQAPAPRERNPEYAARLRRVLETLGFPAGYVDSVR